ncbi:MAG: DUF4445 domain-containing protein [Alphaproteobacteria bacterium]|jgi:uncharacterized 2Fe-2S/4Fe-4S cluster protein (DUF4445 family)|nr:DUF4445 domain-containing protein [Alphaproteobacteria bacterium]
MIQCMDVTVRGETRTIPLQSGDADRPLTQVLGREGLALNTRCGEKGLCDGCLIELTRDDGTTEQRRACELTAGQAAGRKPRTAIGVPSRSLLAHDPQVVSSFKLRVPWADDPLIPDPRKNVGRPVGVAVDIGTTTVAILVIDLSAGRVLGRDAMFNQQTRLGDDVLTRINLCPEALGRLQEAVVDHTLVPLIGRALHAAGRDAADLVSYTVAGNATMLHLLAGVDPSPMGVAPFTAAFVDHRVHAASDLGLPGDAEVHLLPGAAAYVGADLVAGCLASGQAYDDRTTLLVDVGTNGEIILKHGDELVGCATAAGPAFEGGRLSAGMRAADGAIEHIRFRGEALDIDVDVIGEVEPIGVCGSAYLDLLANGRTSGLLTHAGRFAVDHAALSDVEPHVGRTLMLGRANGRTLGVSEIDLSQLLQAKAAIAAGVALLLARFDLEPGDVDRVYLAGGFGRHIHPASAVGCGLLPGFDPQQVEAVGNSALAGAFLGLLDRTTLDEMSRIAGRLEIVELNLDPAFQMTYIEHLSLP